MRASEDFQALAVLFKRVKNIAQELRRRRRARSRARSTEPAERALLDGARRARGPRIEAAVARGDYARAFTDIAGAARRPSIGSSPTCS